MTSKWAHLFELPQGQSFLNSAAWSLQPKRVSEIGLTSVTKKQQAWALDPLEFYTSATLVRNQVAGLMSVSANNMALIPSVSYGMQVAIQNISKKWNKSKPIVLIPDQDFPSTVLSLFKLQESLGAQVKLVNRTPGQNWKNAFEAQISNQVGLVVVPACDWSTGDKTDIFQIRAMADACRAFFVTDLSQSFGACPINVQKLDPDFAFSVGYKWQLGPYGISYMYVSDRFLDGEPLEYNWLNRQMNNGFSSLTQYDSPYLDGARRFDSGELSHFVLAPMAAEALALLSAISVESIYEHVRGLIGLIQNQQNLLRESGYELTQDSLGHMIGIRHSALSSEELTLALKSRGVYVSTRGPYVRVSPHLYNSQWDIENLILALISESKEQPLPKEFTI